MNPNTTPDFINSLHAGFLHGDERAADKQTEARHVELLQDQYRAIERGDFAAFGNLLDEDVDFEIVGPLEIPIVGHHRGRQQVAAAVRKNFSLLEDQRPRAHAVVAQGDTVVIHGQESGRIRDTGRAYDIHWVQILTFRDGKVVKFREVFDSAPILAAMRP
jgi:ketosteroid isomerase-like protein